MTAVLQLAGAIKLSCACLLRVASLQTACAITLKMTRSTGPVSMTITCSTAFFMLWVVGVDRNALSPLTCLSQALRARTHAQCSFISGTSHKELNCVQLIAFTEIIYCITCGYCWLTNFSRNQVPSLLPCEYKSITKKHTC